MPVTIHRQWPLVATTIGGQAGIHSICSYDECEFRGRESLPAPRLGTLLESGASTWRTVATLHFQISTATAARSAVANTITRSRWRANGFCQAGRKRVLVADLTFVCHLIPIGRSYFVISGISTFPLRILCIITSNIGARSDAASGFS